MPPSPSKRNTCSQPQTAASRPVVRKPYRCCKCPDSPLLKDCPVHGKKNRTDQPPKRRPRARNGTPSPAPMPVDPTSGAGQNRDVNVNSVQPVSLTSPTEAQADHAMATEDDNIDPVLRGLQADGTRVATPSRASDEGIGDPHTAAPASEVLRTTLDSTPPQLTAVLNEIARKNGAQTITDNDGSSDWEDDDDDDDEGTKGGAPHGFIDGVMRGNHEFRGLKRTIALRPPSKSSTLASKRFARVIRQILTRTENLAVETGCWIYLAAQHATAVTPFIHYASPRLQAEAGPKLDVIHTNFSIIMKTLVTSRRREAMELMLELEEQKERLEMVQKEADVARKAAEMHREEIGKRDVVIAELMTRLGIET
ncbi:hypothetical protein NP233_g11751 [Leucocoprinus birnbaumii]|uniref:Uncharacterized protein n=1 Tax=Leucocoprinus birnbaumii TaxID=56174 RepID=A0AAD5VG65_9AGAR|nr:hypothetical protein NP233_g11751 [Leucocoprinus birnbaumii]